MTDDITPCLNRVLRFYIKKWVQILGEHSNKESLLFLRAAVCPLYHYIVDNAFSFSDCIIDLSDLAATKDVFIGTIVAEMRA